ncbi:dermonecrotic toxin domain-containing protein [Pseudomonas fildesensis]|uniref:dermonecrotic toxin domain-containing protein n=1 Tax=Pseudomonas fildesensis TaxID=1674920 RepID=UPI00387AF702
MAIALKNPEFQDWIKEKGIAPASIVILPDTGSLSVAINHQRVTFTPNDSSGWSSVAGPLLAASKVVSNGSGDSVHYKEAFLDTAELRKVASFYGVSALEEATVKELERTHTFPPAAPTDPYRSSSVRGESALSEQQQTLAGIYQRHAATPDAPGDSQLVQFFTNEWQKKVSGGNAGLVTIPPDTVLGQWLGLYEKHLEQPVVQHWLNEQGIDLATLTIVPSTGAMSASVNGQTKQFSLTDNSGWRQISGPLLEVAKVIAPTPDQSLSVSFTSKGTATSMKVVAKFYAEPTPANVAQSRQRIDQLNNQKTFNAVPNERQSAHALEVQRGNAEKVYTEAPQKLAFSKLATAVTQAIPNIKSLAKGLAEDIIKQALPDQKNVDADKLWLLQGGAAQSPHPDAGRSGWFFSGEPTKSETLTEAVIRNFSEHDRLPGELDNNGGIYTEGPGQSPTKGYGKHNEFPLDPSVFMRGVSAANFQGIVTQKINDFWNTHDSDFRTLAKGEFVNQARQQLKGFEAKSPAEQKLQPEEQKFTRDDYKWVMGAASNIALDENAPVTLEQLQAETSTQGKLRAHTFDINGWPSDIIRFADYDDGQGNYENNRRDGRQILYIPSATPAFLRFDSLKKMDDWVVTQARDPQKREALASHFSLYNRQDGATFLGKSGVDSSLAHLASGDWESEVGKTIERGNVKVAGDIFSHLKSDAKERMVSDADTAIKSNSEVTRDTWLNDISAGAGLLAKLAPLGWPLAVAAVGTGLTETALGAEKTVSGDTQAERKDGALKTFDGTLNTLFSVTASPGKAKDPFEVPEDDLLPRDETLALPEANQPTPGPSRPNPLPNGTPGITPPRPPAPSLIKMSEHALTNGEDLIKNVTPDALGVYRTQDTTGVYRQFVRYTDETGKSAVFELKGDYKTGDRFASIINPTTGRAVMRVNPGRNGEWARGAADGGVKWPWQRPVSPTPSNELKLPPKVSDHLIELNGSKMKGAEKFDEYLNFDERYPYTYGVAITEDGEVVPQISWTTEENPARATLPPNDINSNFGTNDYSAQFIDDLNRSKFTLEKPDGSKLEIDVGADIRDYGRLKGSLASQEEIDAIKQKNIELIEKFMPDPELRLRVSEVSHQWLLGPVPEEFSTPRFKDTVFGTGRDPHYYINFDPVNNEVSVTAKSDFLIRRLLDKNGEIETITDLNTKASRTITIRSGNEIDGNRYVIEKSAPIRMEITPKLDR